MGGGVEVVVVCSIRYKAWYNKGGEDQMQKPAALDL